MLDRINTIKPRKKPVNHPFKNKEIMQGNCDNNNMA